ncbi:tryptophan--tRNA ligase [Viridibacterium curvum]
MHAERVLSGMRPTGRLHIGHYHGALTNWVRLQQDKECFFFVADWHALTTAYDDVSVIGSSVWDMVIDWLAAGVDPEKSTIFLQSRLPQHAELHVLLSMITPLGWLERVPTYKDQQEKLSGKDLATYGFLGYPLLQSADILLYQANHVPVGEDQVPHIELTREVARRFNHIFGREPDFEEKARAAAKKLGGKRDKQFFDLRTRYQQDGDKAALEQGRALVSDSASLSNADRERLLGYIDGSSKRILTEPGALLTEASRVVGLDGQKMSKSYGNTIMMREEPEALTRKIKTMPTDTQRVRRTDPGEPERCPVWQFHQVYSTPETREWVQAGCRSAGIGCLECKQPVIDAMLAEQAPMHERALQYVANPKRVREVVEHGNERARVVAEQTMQDVRAAMGLAYS